MRRLCCAPGDMPKREWMRKEAKGELPGGEYKLTAIVDERRVRGGKREFLLKWEVRTASPQCA